MATFVLVHGAWHGGWCWKKVTPLLRAAGHEVYTPTLTGLGERVHLVTPEVNLSTHIDDVVNVLSYESLHQVVLVGHSYGGMVIARVADRVADRLAHLVYLDASIPDDGQSLEDLNSPERRARVAEVVRTQGEGWRLPFNAESLVNWEITDEEDARWLRERLVPHPYATFTEPVRLSTGRGRLLPRTFILCTHRSSPSRSAERAQQEPGWRYRELATGHDAM